MAYPVVGNRESDKMNDPKAFNWREWAAVDRHGRVVQRQFARQDDAALRAAWLAKYRHHDLCASVAVYDAPRRQGPGWRPLYFVLAHDDLERLRRAALSACYFLFEFLEIAPDGLEIVYDGNHSVLLAISPLVFDGKATPQMGWINYQLSEELIDAGVEALDVDVYWATYCLRWPNTLNTQTGRYTVPLTFKELLYLDVARVLEISHTPRPNDSLTVPRPVQRATAWFQQTHAAAIRQHALQAQLRARVLQNRWQIPPCIARWQRTARYERPPLEAYRTIAPFFAWIGTGPQELLSRMQAMGRGGHGPTWRTLKAIVRFATENPRFAGCDHALLQRYCGGEKCFLADLEDRVRNPRLLEDMTLHREDEHWTNRGPQGPENQMRTGL